MNVNSDQVTDCVSNSMQPKTELLLIELELQIKNSSDIINSMKEKQIWNWKINFSDLYLCPLNITNIRLKVGVNGTYHKREAGIFLF